jgi:hypothetical protein
MSPVAYNFISSPQGGEDAGEGETAEIRSTLTPTLSRQREREIII